MTQIKKLANAFYSEADPSGAVIGPALYAVNRYKKNHAGLWVGGNIIICNDGVTFVANALNRKLHTELKDIHIPQNAIKSIQYRFGWFTGIVEVHHESGVFLFRCYGAKKLVAQLNGS
jgi:hypothetical protein